MKKRTVLLAIFFLLVLWTNGSTHSGRSAGATIGNIADGMYMIVGESSHRCLDIPNNSCREGARLQTFDCDKTDATNSQKFNVVSDGSGNYTISDLCLEASPDDGSGRIPIFQNTCAAGRISQKWAMSQYGDNLEIRSVEANQCMDVMRAVTKNYGEVNEHACSNGTNQRWKLYKKTLNENGVICRASPAHPERDCYGTSDKQIKTYLGKTLTKTRCEDACAASKMVSCQWAGAH